MLASHMDLPWVATCWKIIFAPVSHSLENINGLDVNIYADDINLGSTEESVLDEGVTILKTSCDSLRLKTEGSKRARFEFSKFASKECVKVTGIRLDCNLKLKEQLEYNTRKAAAACSQIIRLHKIFDKVSAERLFKAYGLPFLEHGNILMQMMCSEPLLRKLQKVQDRFSRFFKSELDSLLHRRLVSCGSLIYKLIAL